MRAPSGAIHIHESPCLPPIDWMMKCRASAGGFASSEVGTCANAIATRNAVRRCIAHIIASLDRRSAFRHSRAVLDTVRQDARFALRSLRRAPGAVAVPMLTLALGIATITAIVSVCDALFLRALPYPDSDRLVALRSIHV